MREDARSKCIRLAAFVIFASAFIYGTFFHSSRRNRNHPTALSSLTAKDAPSRSLASDATTTESKKRPVMHTFYVRIDPEKFHKDTGMTDEADRKMLQHWKHYWSQAGWEPKILTLEDAMKHPDYQTFDDVLDLDKVPFGFYDKLCFLRWLAMATTETGGGWMSDYDTFPIKKVSFLDENNILPHDGVLTVYDQTVFGGIPCLVSGSRDEWDRMAHVLLENLRSHSDEGFWSDMLALFDIHRDDPDSFRVRQGVLRGEIALKSDRKFPTADSCRKMAKHHWAVHFSHNAIKYAEQIREKGYVSRPIIAEGWLNQWANKCPMVLNKGYDPVKHNV